MKLFVSKPNLNMSILWTGSGSRLKSNEKNSDPAQQKVHLVYWISVSFREHYVFPVVPAMWKILHKKVVIPLRKGVKKPALSTC
jgi:hypothetical protein